MVSRVGRLGLAAGLAALLVVLSIGSDLEAEKLRLVTDINTQNSLLLVSGAQEFLQRINFPSHGPHIWELPGVVSRKKQLLPYLLQCLSGVGAN